MGSKYCILAVILLYTGSVSCARQKPTTETCLLPLLDIVGQNASIKMCDLMDQFSQCYVDTNVNRDSAEAMQVTLQAMVTVMALFEQENCDLNEEFNNMCREDFVNCLDHVTEMKDDKVLLHCGYSGYLSFLECVNVELEVGAGPCYFSDWQQRIVNTSRDLECASGDFTPSPTEPQDLDDEGSDSSIISSSHCDVGDVRYHVYNQCTMYQMEWLGMNIRYEMQPVAPGTLFDVSICGLNHAHLVKC